MTNNPATLQLDKETITHTIPGHPSFNRIIDRSTDTLGRSTGFQLQTPTLLTDHSTLYTYSPTNGRFASVSGGAFQAPSQTFIYGYETNSNLIKTIHSYSNYDFTSNTGTGIHTVTNTYETNRDVLLTKHNQRASDNATISSVNYNVNSIGQRTNRTSTDAANATSTAQWGYNATGEKPRRLVGVLDRSEAPCLEEVSSREAAANQLTKADHSDTAQNRSYNYDGIGNRLSSTSPSGASPASAGYTPNALNQYTAVNAFTPTYDDDGNQINAQIHPQSPTSNPASLSPVSCVFSWDGENRKIEVKDTSNNSLVKHHYDSQSRKIATITPKEITLYIYNGWNSIAEYQLQNSSFTLHTSLLWGLDLSGSEQGAGGVGGLLQVTDHSSLITSYFPCYDGNGNVTEYIDSAGAIAAHYQYDAFGNTTVATGSKANDFAYRFSTKPIDTATGLYYYGYRFYAPSTGRWVNRDPIEENGGLNLYAFVANAGVGSADNLGLYITSECKLNEKLDQLNLKYTHTEVNINGKKYHKYSGGNPKIDKNKVIVEILSTMIIYEHEFMVSGKSIDKCWEKLTKHIEAREKIINDIKTIWSKMQFGASQIPEGVDATKQPELCTTDCGGIIEYIYTGVQQLTKVKSSYFIPGDSGYIANTNHSVWQKNGNDNNQATLGQNITYVGNKEFFGHLPGAAKDKYKTLKKWEKYVDSFGGNGKHDTWDFRRTVTTGLTFNPNKSFSWTAAITPAIYHEKGVGIGTWNKVIWPN